MANKFNEYFTNIAQSVSSNIPPASKSFLDYMKPTKLASFVLTPTSPQELISLSHSLKPTHSAGPDKIDPWTCTVAPLLDLLANPLSMVINSSLATGIVPSTMKQARVCLIFKHGLKTDMNNYRPISILPYFSKLFEKVVYTRLYDNIYKLEILYPDQDGFQPNQ